MFSSRLFADLFVFLIYLSDFGVLSLNRLITSSLCLMF